MPNSPLYRQQPEGAPAIGASDPVISALERPTPFEWSREQARTAAIFGFDSIDPRSRSFNLIRGRILDHKRQRGWRMIGVISATPDVGKSFVTANITASLSRDPGTQTFAVDLDLRRGSLSRQFGLHPETGLSDYLEDGAPLQTFVPEGERLIVLPTVGRHLHSAELLASRQARTLFGAMRQSRAENLFVCDLPPVFANDDAVAVMANLDCYILVSEEGRTTVGEIKDAVEALGRERIAGVILNKFQGGLVSDGYGVESYYAKGYGAELPSS